MRRTITLKARPALKSKYHALLREDWGRQTAERVLDLLGELLRASGVRLVFPWEDSGKTARDRRGEVNLGADDFGELLELLERVRLPQLPPLPLAAEKLFVRPGGKLALAATRAWVYLIFQAVCEIRGEAGFFRDLQSLLYLNVVDWLLPELRSAGLAGEHDVLLGALGYHCTAVWPDEPAHQQYLLAILARAIGDSGLEGRALLDSFRLADPGEHDYLTLAQSYWFFLLENHRHEDAEAFLLDVYRQAPSEMLAEVKKMIADTFRGRLVAS